MKILFQILVVFFMMTQVIFAADKLSFTIKPYLQWADKNQITIRWETNKPSKGWVEYGKAVLGAKNPDLTNKTKLSETFSTFQSVAVKNLDTETAYFYRVACVADGDTIYSSISPFKTAVHDHSPFGFIVFSDSQGRPNPTVWEKIALVGERERPNFAIHTGDQVDNGEDQSNWIGQFFPQGQSFMSKYAMYTVPGNHEKDASNYHRYLGHPDGHSCFSFVYGNTEIFMFDSNKDASVNSDIYKKLEAGLAKSTATWKIVAHHHPIYSSDDDDYGNTYQALSTLGSPKLAHLSTLYEKYGVDLALYGHVHVYERSWPLKGKDIDHQNGTVYVTLGGGGGGLERPAPLRSWFTNKLYYGHHVVYIRVAKGKLEFQALDIHGNIIDQFDLTKIKK